MKKYFILEGNHKIESFIEYGGKTFIKSQENALKLKDCVHSNTFMALINGKYVHIPRFCITSEINYNEIFKSIPESKINQIDFTDLSQLLNESELEGFCNTYKLLLDKGKVSRICEEDVLKIVCYLQSLSNQEDFNLFDEKIKCWALKMFQGSSEEIGYYTLLNLYKKQKINDFLEQWAKNDLNQPNISRLYSYILEFHKDESTKKEIIEFILNKFSIV